MTATFDPAPLRPRRRPDPAAWLAVGIAAFLVAAVVKPWDAAAGDGPTRDADGRAATPGPIATSGPAPTPVTSAPPGRASPSDGPGIHIDWSIAADVTARRDAWGIRGIETRPSAAADPVGSEILYRETWTAMTPMVTGPGTLEAWRRLRGPRPTLPTAGRRIVALGVTSPRLDAPLDVRVWRFRIDGSIERLDVPDLPGPAPGGERLFLPPRDERGLRSAWSAGTYRFDVLTAGGVGRLLIHLPGRRSPDGTSAAEPATPAELAAVLGRRGPGVQFVLERAGRRTDRLAAARFPVRASAPLGEHDGWLRGGEIRSPGGSPLVGWAIGARPLALAVVLRPGERVERAALVRLAPTPFARGEAPLPGFGTTRLDRRYVQTGGDAVVGFVAFVPRRSVTWDPGVYRIDLLRSGPRGRDSESFHLDLTGGPVSAVVSPELAAARAWARTWPQDGPPAGVRLAFGARDVDRRVARPALVAPPARPGSICDGATLEAMPDRPLGISAARLDPARLTIEAIDRGGTRRPVALAVRRTSVGALLVRPADAPGWRAGRYAIGLGDGRWTLLCVQPAGSRDGVEGAARPAHPLPAGYPLAPRHRAQWV